MTVHVPTSCIPCRYNAHNECEGVDICECTHTASRPLRLSPLLPIKPDWKQLALECSQAYWAFHRIDMAVRAGEADGKEWWQARNRADAAASAISSWATDPELCGRLLAHREIIEEEEYKRVHDEHHHTAPMISCKWC